MRWPWVAKAGLALAVLTVVAAIGAAIVAAFVIDRDDETVGAVLVADAVDPVAPVAVGDADLIYAERTTGKVIQVMADGTTEVVAVVPDDLRTDGQRGLLGLAVGAVEQAEPAVYASWTRADDDRLVVGRLGRGETMIVWVGPVSADLANGGTLAFRGDSLLIGIGELADPGLVDDPDAPNGKILALDPAGPSDQTPSVVAAGWHNPFAFTVVGDDVWLVDNAPGDEAERVVRIGSDGAVVSEDLTGRRAPSSLAVLPDGDLAVCGYVSSVVERIAVPDVGVAIPDGVIGPPCATGVAVLGDGSVVTTTADAVWRSQPS